MLWDVTIRWKDLHVKYLEIEADNRAAAKRLTRQQAAIDYTDTDRMQQPYKVVAHRTKVWPRIFTK